MGIGGYKGVKRGFNGGKKSFVSVFKVVRLWFKSDSSGKVSNYFLKSSAKIQKINDISKF